MDDQDGTRAQLEHELVATRQRVHELEAARSQQPHAEESLRESEERYRELVDSSPDAVLSIDADMKIRVWNPAAERLFGYRAEEILGRTLLTLVPESDRGTMRMGFRALQEAASPREQPVAPLEVAAQRQDGSVVPIELKLSARRSAHGHMTTAIMRDITERQRAATHTRLITEVQEALLRSCALDDIHRLVSEKVKQLIGDGIVATSQLDEERRTLRMASIQGLDLPMPKMLAIVGFDPQQQEISLNRMTEEDLIMYRSGRLEELTGGLYSLMTGLAPKPACLMVEKLLRVQTIYSMGFVHGDEHLGGLIILARNDITPHIAAIEQIVNLATMAIERRRAEEALRESEEKFRLSLVTGLDASYLATLEEGKIIEINEVFEDVFGYAREEIIGKSSLQLNLYDDPGERARVVAELKAKGRVRDLEVKGRKKGGETIIVSLSIGVLQLQGQPHIFGIIRDITDRRRAEEALRASEEQYRELVENLNDVIFTVGTDGILTYISPPVLQLAGYTPAELIGQPFVGMVHPDDLPVVQRSIGDTRKNRLEPREFRYRNKDGQIRWGRTSSRSILVGDRVVGIRGLFSDVTERKRAETQLNDQLEELQRWHQATLGRETRILDLKREVNELLAQAGQPPRYPSAAAENP